MANNTYADFIASLNELDHNIKSMFTEMEYNPQNALNVARLILNILKMPCISPDNMTEKLDGYSALIRQTISGYKSNSFGVNNINNQFICTRLFLMGALASIASGVAMSVVSNINKAVFLSREAIVNSALQINDLLSLIKDFEDSKITKNDMVDSNASTYFILIEIVHDSIQIILNTSLSLPMRKKIKLERDRNLIELCAEFYNSVDNYYLDKFINDNNLNIDEMEILPMGREVYYYV